MSKIINNEYEAEAAERWGGTASYAEFLQKSGSRSDAENAEITAGLDKIIGEFAVCMQNNNAPDSHEAQEIAGKLQSYISENFYNCTDEIFACLGRMYAADGRFKSNIDRHGEGTADYISEAVGAKVNL